MQVSRKWCQNVCYLALQIKKKIGYMILAHLTGWPYHATIFQEQNHKSNSHSVTGHEGPEVEGVINSTLSLTSMLDGVGGQLHTLASLTPGKGLGTHWTRGCVCPRVIMDRYGNVVLTRFWTLDCHYTTYATLATTSWINMELSGEQHQLKLGVHVSNEMKLSFLTKEMSMDPTFLSCMPRMS